MYQYVNRLISAQILIISMQMSSLADDGGTGSMNIIILLGSTNAMVKGIRLNYLAHSGAKLSMLNE